MTDTTTPAIDAGAEFAEHVDRQAPLQFGHSLQHDPALELEAVADLAAALEHSSIVYEDAVQPLLATGEPGHSDPAHAARLVRTIDVSNSWLTLLNIEQRPEYHALVDRVIESLAVPLGRPASSLRRRMGFVFVSSPNSVTPAHFDIEHSLCIQLRGRRTLSFGTFTDEAQRTSEVHRYWNGSFGRMESMPTPGMTVPLEPGVGAYIPPYTPHWIENGDAASLSLTLTFFTKENENESMVQAFNERMSSLRVPTRPYGRSRQVDAGKAAAMRAYARAKKLVRPGEERSVAR